MASSSKRSLIILGILGLVVLALFVVSVVFGSDGGGGSGCSSRELDQWRDRLFDPEPVERGQLAGCPIATGRTVTVTIILQSTGGGGCRKCPVCPEVWRNSVR
jgi:hypothetical protein